MCSGQMNIKKHPRTSLHCFIERESAITLSLHIIWCLSYIYPGWKTVSALRVYNLNRRVIIFVSDRIVCSGFFMLI
jgi:hypothetical protein